MNLERNLTPKERKEYDVWLLEMQDTIRLKPIENETPAQKKKRIKKLLGNFQAFCNYYFEDWKLKPFGWFHLKAVDYILKNKNLVLACEWPREHAKSVVMDIFVPMFLKAKGELTGVVLASANEEQTGYWRTCKNN